MEEILKLMRSYAECNDYALTITLEDDGSGEACDYISKIKVFEFNDISELIEKLEGAE